jgi:hypothetical protein
VNSPFGSNLPSVPSSPPRIPYSSHIETIQPLHQTNFSLSSQGSPKPPVVNERSIMSLEDCEKLALEMKSTVMKMDEQPHQEEDSDPTAV